MLLRYTPVGAATAILEIGSVRLLTDPALDPPGRRYRVSRLLPGFASTKLAGPALTAGQLGRIDAVLLSHDHHFDNLDDEGRAVLPSAGRVLTTRSGARRLAGNAVGLAPWDTATVTGADGFEVRIAATPARHGPPGSRRLVGDVIGFTLAWDGQRHGELYLSGDTVLFAGIEQVAARHTVSVAVLNLGAAGFRASGPVRYTFDAAEAARAAEILRARTVIPSHVDGWGHFREPAAEARLEFERAGIEDRVRWLPAGVPAEVEV